MQGNLARPVWGALNRNRLPRKHGAVIRLHCDKRATHEIWVGVSGFGKTYLCNCYLTREYAENGIPFDLLEPMGHGKHIARAFGLPWHVLSAKGTTLNPLDPMFPTMPCSTQKSCARALKAEKHITMLKSSFPAQSSSRPDIGG